MKLHGTTLKITNLLMFKTRFISSYYGFLSSGFWNHTHIGGVTPEMWTQLNWVPVPSQSDGKDQ